jgi:ATP-binding cassette subfamily B protein
MLRKYACVRQYDQSDCGAAALATVALHQRMPIGLQQMRELAGTDRVGTNLLGLLKAAEKLGFSAKGVKGPYDALPRVLLPAIAHVRNDEGLGHFVVVHAVSKRRVVLADPARGIRKLGREEFCRCWTGYLLIVVPEQTASARFAGLDSVGPWRRFLGLLGWHTPVLVEAVLCALLMTLLGVATSYLFSTWSIRSSSATRASCSTPSALEWRLSSSSAHSSERCGNTSLPTSAARWTSPSSPAIPVISSACH